MIAVPSRQETVVYMLERLGWELLTPRVFVKAQSAYDDDRWVLADEVEMGIPDWNHSRIFVSRTEVRHTTFYVVCQMPEEYLRKLEIDTEQLYSKCSIDAVADLLHLAACKVDLRKQ